MSGAEIPLAIAAVAASAAATGATAVQADKQAKFQEKVAARNAEIEASNAAARDLEISREQEQRVARLRASAAASGVSVSSGSPLQLLGQVVRRSEEDRILNQQGGAVAVSNQRIAQSAASSRASQARLGGVLGVVGTAAGGASEIAGS